MIDALQNYVLKGNSLQLHVLTLKRHKVCACMCTCASLSLCIPPPPPTPLCVCVCVCACACVSACVCVMRVWERSNEEEAQNQVAEKPRDSGKEEKSAIVVVKQEMCL